MGDGRRETDLRRQPGHRESKAVVLVATNGECTEVDYFKALKHEPWVTCRVIVATERGSPIDLIRGVARRRGRDDFDDAWAVCDVDHYDIDAAEQEAAEFRVRLIWSNPCFEVWLLLHLYDHKRFLDHAGDAKRCLVLRLPGWDKTRLNFSDFRPGIEEAVARAKAGGDDPKTNPFSAVWKVIESVRDETSQPA